MKMRVVLWLVVVVVLAPAAVGHAQGRPTPLPRPANSEEATARVNGLLKNIQSGALLSLRALLVADDRALTTAMSAARAHVNQHGMDYILIKGRAEDTAKQPGTICDALGEDAATVAALRPRLEALIPDANAAIARAEVASYACQSIADADRLDAMAKNLTTLDRDLNAMNTRYTDAAGRLLSAFNKRADFFLMEAELKKRRDLTRAVWRTHYPKADTTRKQYERAVSDAVLEWSVLETVAGEYGIVGAVEEVKAALAMAAKTVNQLNLTIDDPSIADVIKQMSDEGQFLEDAVAAVERAKRYYACNTPQPPMGPAPDALTAMAKARLQSGRLTNAAADCRRQTARPERLGFAQSSVRLKVGQTMTQPKAFATFADAPNASIDVSDLVTYSGVPLPFTPLPEQAGSTFSLTVSLRGRSSTMRILVEGTSPYAGTWDLTGERTIDGRDVSGAATLTLVLAGAAEGARLLERSERNFRDECTKDGPAAVLTGNLAFAAGDKYPNIVACVVGIEIKGRFNDGKEADSRKGWFEISPRDSVGKWHFGNAFMSWFNWKAKRRAQ
jgi:hypothetical protein